MALLTLRLSQFLKKIWRYITTWNTHTSVLAIHVYLAYFFRELFKILLHTLNAEPFCVEYTARLNQTVIQTRTIFEEAPTNLPKRRRPLYCRQSSVSRGSVAEGLD